jgi:hypothetical protein
MIVLPMGKAHVFKKIGTPITTAEAAVPIPLLGYVGNYSYVGPNTESFIKNLLNIKVYSHPHPSNSINFHPSFPFNSFFLFSMDTD